ncbi:tRNA pseudouridine synthase [Candidatus Methylobacter favarea]|uniref:tRNA pseudouridine synthase B n=1 Tax=Candidatus Methylobacter favarea TaxID=2707345 RepID=A0A8S0X807_9GAMM|nr:tRNA pseudouridine(55) synthase TruB [Candidatus Methylobacter favarea]CAA9890580.1 tRNA pseudouridine synthase [Candidatus Methylobacter favarea]
MSKRKSGHNIDGILLLDKRPGVSSNKALQEVRRLFNANKAGHTGSLDPLATGLLPLCFGEATKVSAMMLEDDKRYQVVIQLGIMTDTGDMEGVVIETKALPALSIGNIDACLKKFTGKINQVPPMYSALKHKGRKLYELAREGKTVERKARQVNIFELSLVDFSTDTLTLHVWCSKGTYIRSLAEDIGHYLGCCGMVKELRRLQAGPFSIKNALTIDQLTAMDKQSLLLRLIKVDKPLAALPAVQLSDEQAIRIKYGQSLIYKKESFQGLVRMYNSEVFLGLGEMLLDGKLAPKKLFNLSNEKG